MVSWNHVTSISLNIASAHLLFTSRSPVIHMLMFHHIPCISLLPVFPFFIFSSVQFSCSVVSDSLWPHELQHSRFPYSCFIMNIFIWPIFHCTYPLFSCIESSAKPSNDTRFQWLYLSIYSILYYIYFFNSLMDFPSCHVIS